MDLFDELHSAGNTVLLVTHEPDIAQNAWRQVLLRDGKVMDDHPTVRGTQALAAGPVART
jgi:putative ABC transport system ATP-binding protein